MSKLPDSFAVRTSRRLYENTSKVCPVCGESDPLVFVKDGHCANCASRNGKEEHHLLGKAFRVSKEDEEAVIPVSPNVHRLLSDMQSGHPAPPADSPDSDSFLEALCWEMIASLAELWCVLTYLHEQPEVVGDLPLVMLFPLAGLLFIERSNLRFPILPGLLLLLLLMTKPNHLDLSKVGADVQHA